MMKYVHIFLLGVALSVVSCSHAKYDPSKTARLYLQADPVSLDPRLGGERRSQTVLRELFEGLTRFGPKGQIELAIASSYTVSKDGLVYTFTLNPSHWSNGSSVTAEDFVYAWKSCIDPHFPTPFSYAFFIIKNAKDARFGKISLDEVGVKALDKRTLQVTLEHPTPYFLEIVANPLYSPIYKPSVEKDQNWHIKSGKEYVCNGPFTLKERITKSHILLEKNPFYTNRIQPKLQYISFSILEDPNTAYSLFCRGDLDWLGDPCGNLPLEVIHTLNKDKKLIKQDTCKLFWLVVGTQHKHLSSPAIRKAIATACNRQALCSYLLKSDEQPAFSILPQKLTRLNKPLFEDGNVEKARELFQQGLKEIGMSKEEYPGLVLTHWSDPTDKAVAQALQEQIQKTLEIPVTLVSADWATFFKRVTTPGAQEMGGFGWFPWYLDPMYNLEAFKYKNNGINGSSWESQAYIDLLNRADQALDANERNQYIQQAEELIMTDMPIIPLFTIPYKYAKVKGLSGEALSPNGLIELKYLTKQDISE